jgi:hypothetical protein
MALNPNEALNILRTLGFHTYHAKSWNESLLIHSFSVYSLVNGVLPFTQIYSENEKELMRWAALLHDYGKTGANWQKAKRGPHKVSLGDTKYEILRSILCDGIARYSSALLSEKDLDDILFIISHHHASGKAASTPARNRMKDIVSECDQAVSQTRISDDLIHTLNAIVDPVRYRLFVIELIEHPISPIAIGAFDYIFSATQHVTALIYSSTSTLYVGEIGEPLPTIEEVNAFLNEHLEGGTVLKLVGGNARIYTEETGFLKLASDPDHFVAQAAAQANAYCQGRRRTAERDPSAWSEEMEETFLYGRVCGTTYNDLLRLCGVPAEQEVTLKDGKKISLRHLHLEQGSRTGPVTVRDLEFLGLKRLGRTYEQTLREILELLSPVVKRRIGRVKTGDYRYDVRELLVPDSSVYPVASSIDPKAEALADYQRYMRRQPLDICPTCNQFPQGNVSAAAFGPSPMGGTVEVFYTRYMRLIKKEGHESRGVSFCGWCSKWWDLISVDSDLRRQMYHLCVMPHHLFARLDWREILKPDPFMPLVELGASGTLGSGVYPHIAMLSLGGKNREALLKELVAEPKRDKDQILDRLYRYGLKGAVIVTNPISSRSLLASGSLSIDASEWPLLRRPLRLLNSGKCTYKVAIRAFQQSEYAIGTLLSDGSIPVTKSNEGEIAQMVAEIAEKTGLSFLADIWIGPDRRQRVENASKVIRGMNETLRRLKDKEDDESLIDAMIAKGQHLALSTRQGKFRAAENQPHEEAALRSAAQKILKYKNQTYRRTELVRTMIYMLAYFSRPDSPAAAPMDPGLKAAKEAS